MSKILFLIPKSKSMFGDDNALPGHPHVGIAYLTSVLKNEKHLVKIFDDGIENNRDRLVELFGTFNPDIVCITAFSYNYKYFIEAIEIVKRIKNIPVVVGGPHVSATKKSSLIETHADFAIKGEGELTLPELIFEMQKDAPHFENISGLIWKQGAEIIENPDREFIEDLNQLPFPDYEAFGFEKYPYYQERKIPIITSRGCPSRCNYCSVRLSMGKRFRSRSANNVFDEIKYWHDKGFRIFEINDDNFAFNKKRAIEICDLIIDSGLNINFHLYNGIRVDNLDENLLKKMKMAGCKFVAFGCETGNEDVLKTIKKGITLDQVRKAVVIAKKLKLHHSVNFIIGHPGENYEKAMDSIRFAKSLDCDFVNFYNLVPYAGTDLYNWAMENAHFLVPKDSYLNDISYRDNNPIFETPDFTATERKKVMKKGFDLYEYSVIRFRFGKIIGSNIYYLTRNQHIAKISRNLLLNTRIGKKIHAFVIQKSTK